MNNTPRRRDLMCDDAGPTYDTGNGCTRPTGTKSVGKIHHRSVPCIRVQSGRESVSTLSLHSQSLAHSWRARAPKEQSVGEEAVLTVHCGQPAWPAAVTIQALPLHGTGVARREPSAEEESTRTVHLRDTSKGRKVSLRYGPLTRAGPHLVCATLNRAHITGSPFLVSVRPGVADAARSSLRGMADGALCGVSAGVAGEEVRFSVVLRDRYGNRCDLQRAHEACLDAQLELVVEKSAAIPALPPEGAMSMEMRIWEWSIARRRF
eukprot:4573017-Pleurochrysis_carterae.AAC.3